METLFLSFQKTARLKQKGGSMKLITRLCSVIVTVAMVAVFVGVPVAIAWEPTKTDRVCNSRGYRRRRRSNGATDGRHQRQAQARPRAFIVVNKSGGAGAEGSCTSRKRKPTPTRLSLRSPTCSRRRLPTGTPFNWKDLTPLARIALDHFILWVNAESPTRPPRST